MGRLAALAAALAVGFVLFYSGARTPPPLPADAPAAVFSAGRAMTDIDAMAAVPHPLGSAQNARVRDRLVARMTRLGLAPQVQRAIGQNYAPRSGVVFGAIAPVENVIGVLPGRDRSLPALALMAHYDSVPGSPGAADDMAGVATALEIVRALKTGGTPARDVMLVITDGEEAGLLGAQAFYDQNPLARHIGFVLNMDTRGGGGRAAMFETGDGNGAAIDLYRRVAPRPSANSLAVFLYKKLPNDTDYTVAKSHGTPGLNFAFIGRQFDYHSPSSTPAALDQGSVQHMGDQVLALARAMAFSQALPPRQPDAVYATLFGRVMLAYPQAAGWIPIGLAALLLAAAAWRARGRQALGWLDIAQGAGASLLIMAASALALHLTRGATGFDFGWIEGRGLLARFAPFEVAMAFSGVGAVVLVAEALSQGRARMVTAVSALAAGLVCSLLAPSDLTGLIEGGVTAGLALALLGRPASLAGSWLGLLLVALLGAVVLQVLAPTTAHIIAWPLVVAGAGAAILALGAARGAAAWLAVTVVAAVAIAWTGDLFHNLLQGLDIPELPLLPLWLGALAVWPLAWPDDRPRLTRFAPGAALAALGLALALGLHFTSPWSPRHPRAAEPYYVLDRDQGRAYRASPFEPDPWARAVLTADGGGVSRLALPAIRRPVWAAPAAAIADRTTPPIGLTRSADGRLTLTGGLDPGQRLDLALESDAPLTEMLVAGRPAPILRQSGQWARLTFERPLQAATLSFKPAGHGSLQVQYARYAPGWPAGVKPLPPMPADAMAWDRAGSTVVVGRLNVRW